MVIGLLTNEYPTEPFFAGGLASYLQRLAEGLVKRGHSVEVFVSAAENEHYEVNGVRVNRVLVTDTWGRSIAGRPLLWRTEGVASTLQRAWMFERAVRARSTDRAFDIIQVPDYLAPGMMLALRGRVPVVTRISHYGPLWDVAYGREATIARRQLHEAERHQMGCSCAVYGPSTFLAERVARVTGIDVKVVPPPYDTADTVSIASKGHVPPELEGTSYALFFGTIGLLKGADRIVEVLPEVLRACPDMTFVFAGEMSRTADGRTFAELVATDLREFHPRVVVLPALRHESLWPIVARSRFVVLPSRFDNLPNACLEAMALARPVIASMHASFDEMIDAGISGQLVPQGSVEALAGAMIQFWRMPASELDMLGRAARAALERLAPERTFPPLESLYQRVIRQHHDKRCPRHRREAIDWARELARLASNPAVSDDGAGSTSRA